MDEFYTFTILSDGKTCKELTLNFKNGVKHTVKFSRKNKKKKNKIAANCFSSAADSQFQSDRIASTIIFYTDDRDSSRSGTEIRFENRRTKNREEINPPSLPPPGHFSAGRERNAKIFSFSFLYCYPTAAVIHTPPTGERCFTGDTRFLAKYRHERQRVFTTYDAVLNQSRK